jgi:hypothetical protein
MHFFGLVYFFVSCTVCMGKITFSLPDSQAANVSYPEPTESCAWLHILSSNYNISVTEVIQAYVVEYVWQKKINYA